MEQLDAAAAGKAAAEAARDKYQADATELMEKQAALEKKFFLVSGQASSDAEATVALKKRAREQDERIISLEAQLEAAAAEVKATQKSAEEFESKFCSATA